MAKLEVRHLTISFRTNNGAVRAVRDISFNLNEGETLAIAGESGSGKSVTTRAVMGILAGNAMVDNGEIIYDGKDLLKIPEEEFHTLRGHKLSMVFQDPLSALNPIMRIGKQLTEAMILNNKERRADGKARFNSMLTVLEKKMVAARQQAGQSGEEVKGKIQTFRDFVAAGVKLENAYNEAKEACVEAGDCLDEMDEAILKARVNDVRSAAGRMAHALTRVQNEYLMTGHDDLQPEGSATHAMAHAYEQRDADKMTAQIAKFRAMLNDVINAEAPNFFCIGYTELKNAKASPASMPVSQLNAEARAMLDREFMIDFLGDVSAALAYSDKQAADAKQQTIETLRKELPVFQQEKLDRKACKAAANRAAEAVQHAIDPLALDKDSLAYVFKSSMMAYIERYFRSLTHNPKEEKRFARETVKHDRAKAKGKIVASVVPKNLIDGEAAKRNMTQTIETLIAHFEEQMRSSTGKDFDALAVDMIDYLKARAQDYAFHLSQDMARHRAIELMREVGIPEPHKRYTQYPFEFSGGMRQRIVIAIALSANPDILICDEPTTALDVTIQAQILELINRLKRERNLSVIFITHDLGVVANMADRIAIMYAGKIVEYGTADDVFYDPKHPYTWALLSSMPDLETKEKLEAIPGTPPDMIIPPKGDAFAARNKYAMQIDFEEQPPMFQVNETHTAATWLLHPDAPKVEPPAIVTERIRRMKALQAQEMNAKHEGGANA